MIARIAIIVVVAFSVGMAGALYLKSMSAGDSRVGGKALIGGPFSLVNHKGEDVTEQDFAGKHMLVSFGYTYCPDICPAELQMMSDAMEKLGASGEGVVPIFVTIDPKRDTVAQMADYVSHFHPRLVGLTGTQEQIKKAAEAYRVFYARSEGSAPDDEAYLMDHSTFIYLMNREGEYIRHFPYGTTAEQLSAAISDELARAS